ncbi:MAG: type II toxin-antitoxin system PemK/MazF family toxin [Bacteroidetes bacterium]|nr:type II toxin-antitoxin system PemK/MazF family toxin [Bacteroidota bacterium]
MKHKIVLVPFPFDDLSGLKVRPAVCLTDSIGMYDHVVIAFITSQAAKANEPSDLIINSLDQNFSLTGLKVTSAVRLHRLITVPVRIIQRQLGDLPPDYHAGLGQRLRSMFGL